jgi:hypothetical protein
MAEPFQGGNGEWGMGSGEWQSPMDATHALIPYSLITTCILIKGPVDRFPLGHRPRL